MEAPSRVAPYAKDPVYMDFGTAPTTAELARLLHLKQLGLSKQDIGDRWLIRSDFLGQLREMKAVQDRAHTLFRSGVAISDPHAPMEYSVVSKRLIGRVLLNSEDERTGALQTIFETTEGNIEIIRHDGTLRAAWSRGDLAPGNVVTIDSLRSGPGQALCRLSRQRYRRSRGRQGARLHRAPNANDGPGSGGFRQRLDRPIQCRPARSIGRAGAKPGILTLHSHLLKCTPLLKESTMTPATLSPLFFHARNYTNSST